MSKGNPFSIVSWISSEVFEVGKKKKKSGVLLSFAELLLSSEDVVFNFSEIQDPYFQDVYEEGSDAKGVIRGKTVKFKCCNPDAMT